jgi:hypothetical protein
MWVIVLPFFFALVENLEKQHPGKLADALGIAIDTVVLAHDVLDGFYGTADIHVFRSFRCIAGRGLQAISAN